MARLSFLLTVLVICVISAQGKKKHRNSDTTPNPNTNIDENELIHEESNRGARFLDTSVTEALANGIESVIGALDGDDEDDDDDDDDHDHDHGVVSEKERKPPSRGDQSLTTRPTCSQSNIAVDSNANQIKDLLIGVVDDVLAVPKEKTKPPGCGGQSLVEIFNALGLNLVRPGGNGRINSDRNQVRVGQPKPDSDSVPLSQIIRDSPCLQSNIQVAENTHVDSNSNRIKGQLIGVVGDDGVVPEEQRKPPSPGGQNLVELLNAIRLNQVRPGGNGKINSDRNQFRVGQPKPNADSVPLPQLIRDSAKLRSNITVAGNPHVHSNSNPSKGESIGVVDDVVVVPEEERKPQSPGGQSLVELLNAMRLNQVRPGGNGKINSDRNQSRVGQPKPDSVPVPPPQIIRDSANLRSNITVAGKLHVDSHSNQIKSQSIGVVDDDVVVPEEERKPPSPGDQSLVELLNAIKLNRVRPGGNGKINSDRNHSRVGQPKPDSVPLTQINRDSANLRSNITVAEKLHVDSNSNRIKSQSIGVVDDDVVVPEEERKPPSPGDQSLVELLNAIKLNRVRPGGNGKINSDRNQFRVGQQKPDSDSVSLPQLIRDSAKLRSNITVAGKLHVDSNSNRIKGQLIGVVGDDVVVPEEERKPPSPGDQSLVELLNAIKLNRVRPGGNGKINSDRNQFRVGQQKPDSDSVSLPQLIRDSAKLRSNITVAGKLHVDRNSIRSEGQLIGVVGADVFVPEEKRKPPSRGGESPVVLLNAVKLNQARPGGNGRINSDRNQFRVGQPKPDSVPLTQINRDSANLRSNITVAEKLHIDSSSNRSKGQLIGAVSADVVVPKEERKPPSRGSQSPAVLLNPVKLDQERPRGNGKINSDRNELHVRPSKPSVPVQGSDDDDGDEDDSDDSDDSNSSNNSNDSNDDDDNECKGDANSPCGGNRPSNINMNVYRPVLNRVI